MPAPQRRNPTCPKSTAPSAPSRARGSSTSRPRRRSCGFSPTDPEWCNLGQGQPETGELPGAPPRVKHVDVALDDQDYAPVAGLWELREAIASLYNALYRRGMPSQYSAENVCVSGGGRAALTRAAASLGHVNLGHFLPDYTAYEELLDIFKAFTAIPILLEGERGYAFGADDLRREILGRGLSAHPDEQPVQPDGQARRGRGARALGRDGARARLRAAARRVLLALHLPRRRPGACPSRAPRATSRTSTAIRSSSSTASRRTGATPAGASPGRSAPKNVVEALASAGSFLDGGGSKPLQRAAVPLLAEDHVVAETQGDPDGVPREARLPALAARAARRARRPGAGRDVLRVGLASRSCRRR